MAALHTAIFFRIPKLPLKSPLKVDKSPCDLIPTSGTWSCNKVWLTHPQANFRETFPTFCQITLTTCLVAVVIVGHLKSLGLVVELGGLLLGLLQPDLGIPSSLKTWTSGGQQAEVRNSGSQVVNMSGNQEVKKSASQDVGKSGAQNFKTPETHSRKKGIKEIRKTGGQEFKKPGFQEVLRSGGGNQGVRNSRSLETREAESEEVKWRK